MSTTPNQGKNSDQDRYGGYAGYRPRKPKDDPYGAFNQPSDNQQGGTAGTAGEQSDPGYVYGQQQSYGSSSTSSGQRQQSSTYQPPSSVARGSYGSSSKGSTRTRIRLKSNQAAALSYLGAFVTGLFFLFWRRQDRLVRFSAAQSIVLSVPVLIILGILQFIGNLFGGIWLIGWLIAGLFGIVSFLIAAPAVLVWLFLMVQALRGVEVKLPYVGKYAEWLSGLFAPKNTGY